MVMASTVTAALSGTEGEKYTELRDIGFSVAEDNVWTIFAFVLFLGTFVSSAVLIASTSGLVKKGYSLVSLTSVVFLLWTFNYVFNWDAAVGLLIFLFTVVMISAVMALASVYWTTIPNGNPTQSRISCTLTVMVSALCALLFAMDRNAGRDTAFDVVNIAMFVCAYLQTILFALQAIFLAGITHSVGFRAYIIAIAHITSLSFSFDLDLYQVYIDLNWFMALIWTVSEVIVLVTFILILRDRVPETILSLSKPEDEEHVAMTPANDKEELLSMTEILATEESADERISGDQNYDQREQNSVAEASLQEDSVVELVDDSPIVATKSAPIILDQNAPAHPYYHGNADVPRTITTRW